MNVKGVADLRCIAGFWHYSIPTGMFSKQVIKFKPESDCSKDRGIDARIKEKISNKQ